MMRVLASIFSCTLLFSFLIGSTYGQVSSTCSQTICSSSTPCCQNFTCAPISFYGIPQATSVGLCVKNNVCASTNNACTGNPTESCNNPTKCCDGNFCETTSAEPNADGICRQCSNTGCGGFSGFTCCPGKTCIRPQGSSATAVGTCTSCASVGNVCGGNIVPGQFIPCCDKLSCNATAIPGAPGICVPQLGSSQVCSSSGQRCRGIGPTSVSCCDGFYCSVLNPTVDGKCLQCQGIGGSCPTLPGPPNSCCKNLNCVKTPQSVSTGQGICLSPLTTF